MKIPNRIAVSLIKAYQATLSPQRGLLLFLYKTPFLSLTPGTCAGCRFHPTCSEYTRQNFAKLTFFTALKRSLRRLGRCHPL